MGRLDDRLLDHPLHTHLNEARAALNSVSEEARSIADGTAPEGTWTRAHDALNYLEGLLSAADPTLVWQGLLDSLQNQLSQTQVYASQLISQPQQVGPLDQSIDALVGSAAQLASTVRITAERAKRVDAALGRAITGTVRDLRAQVKRLEAEAATLEQRQQEAADDAMAAEEQRRAEIGVRLDELRAAVTAEKTRLDALVPSFEQQFASSQQARDQQHATAIATFDQESGALIKRVSAEADQTEEALRTSMSDLLESAKASITGSLEAVQEKRDEVDKLYGVITDTGTAGAFREHAREQKKQADIWRLVAVAFAMAAAGAAIWAASHSDDSTAGLVARLSLGAAAGAIAAYAGRQSARHRSREEDARQLELDMTAFGPFIESLPEEMQQQAREELLKRTFIGRVRSPEGGALTEESFGLLNEAVNLVLKAGRVRPPG